jgi:hypothetical protein
MYFKFHFSEEAKLKYVEPICYVKQLYKKADLKAWWGKRCRQGQEELLVLVSGLTQMRGSSIPRASLVSLHHLLPNFP